ncbi:hypothetical protein OC835_000419 [Tilletia horrida]|nr:hypothetical protein OC835_000419 [Tilletia horrida]
MLLVDDVEEQLVLLIDLGLDLDLDLDLIRLALEGSGPCFLGSRVGSEQHRTRRTLRSAAISIQHG